MSAGLVIIANNKDNFLQKINGICELLSPKDFPIPLTGVVLNDLTNSQNLADQIPGLKIYSEISEAAWADKETVFWIRDPLAIRTKELEEILLNPAKAVICDSPLSTNFENAVEIVSKYIKADRPLIINDPTYYCPRLQQISAAIQNGLIGNFLGGNAYYSSGLMNGGILLLSLIYQILGMPQYIQATPEATVEGADPIIGGRLSYHAKIHLNVCGIDVRDYELFELDLCGTQGRILLRGLPTEYQIHLLNGEGKSLTMTHIPFSKPEAHPDLGVLHYVEKFLKYNIPETGSGLQSLTALRLALSLSNSHLAGGRRLSLKRFEHDFEAQEFRSEQIA